MRTGHSYSTTRAHRNDQGGFPGEKSDSRSEMTNLEPLRSYFTEEARHDLDLARLQSLLINFVPFSIQEISVIWEFTKFHNEKEPLMSRQTPSSEELSASYAINIAQSKPDGRPDP